MARDFTPDPERYPKQLAFLKALAAGATPTAAAAQAGTSVRTFYTWRRRNPSFRAAWLRARAWARRVDYPAPAELAPRPPADDGLTVILTSFDDDRPEEHITTRRLPTGEIVTERREVWPTAEERAAIEAEAQAWERKSRGESS